MKKMIENLQIPSKIFKVFDFIQFILLLFASFNNDVLIKMSFQ